MKFDLRCMNPVGCATPLPMVCLYSRSYTYANVTAVLRDHRQHGDQPVAPRHVTAIDRQHPRDLFDVIEPSRTGTFAIAACSLIMNKATS